MLYLQKPNKMEEIAKTAEFIPIGCEFVFYSLMMAITALGGVVIFLFLRLESLYKQLIRFAGKGTEALETLSKLSK